MVDNRFSFNSCVGLMSLSSSPAGLQILYTLLQNVSNEEAAAQSFYQTYFCDILQHIFSVVTDTSHTAGKAKPLYRPNFISHSCIKVNLKFWFKPLPACPLPVYRSDHARHHLGLHVQPGGGGEGQRCSECCQSSQQPGARPGVHRQPAEDGLPPPARVSMLSPSGEPQSDYICCVWLKS